MSLAGIVKALKVVRDLARTDFAQRWRKVFAKNSARELKRRENK